MDDNYVISVEMFTKETLKDYYGWNLTEAEAQTLANKMLKAYKGDGLFDDDLVLIAEDIFCHRDD